MMVLNIIIIIIYSLGNTTSCDLYRSSFIIVLNIIIIIIIAFDEGECIPNVGEFEIYVCMYGHAFHPPRT